MAAIASAALPPGGDVWQRVAATATHWLARQRVAPRDAVLLLPFAALLPPARAAFAAAGGWMPRIETPLTLAASLGPPPRPAAGECSGDTTADRIEAGLLLRHHGWAAEWHAHDAAGLSRIEADVADAARRLLAGARERPPEQRDAWWAAAREAAPAPAGPAAFESSLLRLAIEWAAQAGPAATDALFALRPSAWLVLRLGGPDALAESLLGRHGTPSLLIDADPPADDPFAGAGAQLALLRCADFEAEAQAAAAQVVAALNAGRTPVALVALDRELVRRVRALLDRAAVPLVDETGWVLATTRAAAAVLARVEAAMPGAGPDARLDWLKAWPAAPPAALDALEAVWRRRRGRHDDAGGQRLQAEADAASARLRDAPAATLAGWLALLRHELSLDGSLAALEADAAGAQVAAALGWQGAVPWQAAAARWPLDLAGFAAWLRATLESTPYLPPPDAGAEVVLTPLARAFGRGFAQVVVPGADERHLGAAAALPGLVGDAFAAALGLESSLTRRRRQRLALAQLLHGGRIVLLHRQRDGDEPIAESPDVAWLQLARRRSAGRPWPVLDWVAPLRETPAAPMPPPQPMAAEALPAVLGASQLEALRQCPYRFFARAVLRLDDADELEAGIAKRDYGDWLHAVLYRFHRAIDEGDAASRLRAAADAVTAEQPWEPSELLPYRASFERFAPAYLRWLAAREAAGWRWHDGEATHEADLGPVRLKGRIDRIDHGPAGERLLIDYKTGSTQGLKDRVAEPLEDTQLAFYAALLGADDSLAACYLALDDAKAPLPIAHPAVHRTAAVLRDAVAAEWQRLRAGHPMPALGEGRVCETCEARGLCRKDDRSDAAAR